MTDFAKRSISLEQAQELYQYDYSHIEPVAIQKQFIDRELPTNEWIVEAVMVGYEQFRNIRLQQQAAKDTLEDEKKQQAESNGNPLIFLLRAIWDTYGLRGIFVSLGLVLKHFFTIIGILNLFSRTDGDPSPEEVREQVLETSLGADLSRIFRRNGVVGLVELFRNFSNLEYSAGFDERLAEQRDLNERLSPKDIKEQNDVAIIEQKQRFKEGLTPTNDTIAQSHFDTVDQFKSLFKAFNPPQIATTFEDDDIFAYMRIAGPNPLMLRRFPANESEEQASLLQKFPVTNAQFQAVMGTGDDLTRAIAENRVYYVDYALVDGAQTGTLGPIPQQQKYIYAAIALFAVPSKDHCDRYLRPIAIQCGQDPSQYPIITPATGKYQWLSAKTAIQVVDGNVHEAISHLADTHLFVEPFGIATCRQLEESHPVYRLLRPHFEGTILINFGAWKLLTAPGQGVNDLLAGTIEQSRTVAVKGFYLKGFNERMLPDLLEEWGVMDKDAFPLYPYRDDALAIWEAVHTWVTTYVNEFYADDKAVSDDQQLKNWSMELASMDGGRVRNFGDQGTGIITTRAYLAKALTLVIFTASAQHAAVNFPQRGIMSFAPAQPLSGYLPAEEIPDIDTENRYCEFLPPKNSASSQLLLLQILGGVYYTKLGRYREGYFQKAPIKAAAKAFLEALHHNNDVIDKRNADLPAKFKYEYLRSNNIPQSINI